MSSTTTTPSRLLRREEVERVTGLARSTIYDGIRAGTFPKPIPLTTTARAWVESEVLQFVADRIAARDAKGGVL